MKRSNLFALFMMALAFGCLLYGVLTEAELR